MKERRTENEERRKVSAPLPRHSRAGGNPVKDSELEELLSQIASDYPDLEFIEGTRFSWHAGKRHVSYRKSSKNVQHDLWALLHELGHALLDHADFRSDIELLQLEAAAWDKARELAKNYNAEIDPDYIQDCLDTYRDWLHLRATCPACYGRSLQTSTHSYRCFNCQTEWSVTRSRLCRPYRLQTG